MQLCTYKEYANAIGANTLGAIEYKYKLQKKLREFVERSLTTIKLRLISTASVAVKVESESYSSHYILCISKVSLIKKSTRYKTGHCS